MFRSVTSWCASFKSLDPLEVIELGIHLGIGGDGSVSLFKSSSFGPGGSAADVGSSSSGGPRDGVYSSSSSMGIVQQDLKAAQSVSPWLTMMQIPRCPVVRICRPCGSPRASVLSSLWHVEWVAWYCHQALVGARIIGVHSAQSQWPSEVVLSEWSIGAAWSRSRPK